MCIGVAKNIQNIPRGIITHKYTIGHLSSSLCKITNKRLCVYVCACVFVLKWLLSPQVIAFKLKIHSKSKFIHH